MDVVGYLLVSRWPDARARHARASIVTRRKLVQFTWDVLPQLPYSVDLARSGYHLEDRKSELERFFSQKTVRFYIDGTTKLPQRWRKVIGRNAAQIENNAREGENVCFSAAVKTERAFPMIFNAIVRATSGVGRGKQKIRLLGTWWMQRIRGIGWRTFGSKANLHWPLLELAFTLWQSIWRLWIRSQSRAFV